MDAAQHRRFRGDSAAARDQALDEDSSRLDYEDAVVEFGTVYGETLGNAMRVTVVAVGLIRYSERAAGSRRLSGAYGHAVAADGRHGKFHT